MTKTYHVFILHGMNQIFLGNSEKILKTVPDGSIHLCFTSPPYFNARDYSFYESYQDYLNKMKEIFTQIHRVLEEGRFFVLNTSPVLIARESRQHQSKRLAIPFHLNNIVENIGFEFIEDIIWLKPETAAKNRNGGFFQHRKPLAYKPNIVTEYIMVYRKKTEKLIDWNIRKHDQELVKQSLINGSYESSNVWQIDPSYTSQHPATFPLILAEKVIKFYSFVGDTVLDPFAGSGTTGLAAIKNNRKYSLIEAQEKYFKIIQNKLHSNSLL